MMNSQQFPFTDCQALSIPSSSPHNPAAPNTKLFTTHSQTIFLILHTMPTNQLTSPPFISAQTATSFYILQRGTYQVSLNNASPSIRASMLMMQPGPPQQRGGSMSSEYPDCRVSKEFQRTGDAGGDEGDGGDVYVKAAQDYLEMNKVKLKDLNVK